MKYEIEFDNNTVEYLLDTIASDYEWANRYSEEKDLMRNIVNVSNFENTVRNLNKIGAETEVGTYEENGYLFIGYARINNYTFVKNREINYQALKDALWDIAHKEPKSNKTLIQILEEEDACRTERGPFGMAECKESIKNTLKYCDIGYYTQLEHYMEKANSDSFFNKRMVLACWELINGIE